MLATKKNDVFNNLLEDKYSNQYIDPSEYRFLQTNYEGSSGNESQLNSNKKSSSNGDFTSLLALGKKSPARSCLSNIIEEGSMDDI